MPVESGRAPCNLSQVTAFARFGKYIVPSLLRFLLVLAILAGLGYAGIWALATMVQPVPRETTFTVPNDRFAK